MLLLIACFRGWYSERSFMPLMTIFSLVEEHFCTNIVWVHTCQVRVLRFYVSLPASSFLPPSSAPRWSSIASSRSAVFPARPQQQPGSKRSPPDLHRKPRIKAFPARTSTASPGSKCSPAGPPPASPGSKKCSPPDLHRKPRIKVFPAGPPPQALDQSVPRRTSTASSGSKCLPPDLHRKPRIRVFPAGPPPQAPDQTVPRRTSTASSGSERSPPDLHRKLRIRVFPAEPPPQAPDQRDPRRTSTASSGSDFSPPDLNHTESSRQNARKNVKRYARYIPERMS